MNSAASYRLNPTTPMTDDLKTNICTLPPRGWKCSRAAGHEGPCAATPIEPTEEVSEDTKRLQAIQDKGADWDIYAEPDGMWSIRERSGERTLFPTIHECADALINLQ